MGRRWGKSTLGGVITLAAASHGAKWGWLAPTYKNARPLWRWAESISRTLGKLVQINRSERTISFSNGGFLGIYSGDNPDAIRGDWFHGFVLDEASRLAESILSEVIQPALADVDGEALLISTPFGKNWFYKEYLKGADRTKEIASWKAPTRDNPNPRIKRAADLAEKRVGNRTFRQEWLAEFVDDGGEVFRFLERAKTATKQLEAIPGHAYVMGIDWGKQQDFTVITIIDMSTRELVYMDRFNEIDYEVQIPRVIGCYKKFLPLAVIAEQNNIGIPLIEKLQREKLPVRAFITSNATKSLLVEDLQAAFEYGTIKILDDSILISELESFEMERLPSGLPRYSAPAGMHDDCAISLMLAWHGVADSDRGIQLPLNNESHTPTNLYA